MVCVGKKVADFFLPATGDTQGSLEDFRGRNLVLYFYPKNRTPGCTLEGHADELLDAVRAL